MDKRKRITREDINVPASAHVVPKGYPVHMWEEMGWAMTICTPGSALSFSRIASVISF